MVHRDGARLHLRHEMVPGNICDGNYLDQS